MSYQSLKEAKSPREPEMVHEASREIVQWRSNIHTYIFSSFIFSQPAALMIC